MNLLYDNEEDNVKIFREGNNIVFSCEEDKNSDYSSFFLKVNGFKKIKDNKINWIFKTDNNEAINLLNKITSEDISKDLIRRDICNEETPMIIFPINEKHHNNINSKSIKIINYTKLSLVLFCTKEWADEINDNNNKNKHFLNSLNFTFNYKLTDYQTGEKSPGWVVAKSNLKGLEFLGKIIDENLIEKYYRKNNYKNKPEKEELKAVEKTVCSELEMFYKIIKSLEENHINLRKQEFENKLILFGRKKDVDEEIKKEEEKYEVSYCLENKKNKMVLLEEL